jgi:hypothetical protein
LLPLDLAATKEYQSRFTVCPHVTAVLMRIPSKSAMTGAGRSEANAANAVLLACRAYKPRRQLCREKGLGWVTPGHRPLAVRTGAQRSEHRTGAAVRREAAP